MESFFKKYKKDFSEIKDRLVEFSKKIGLSVGEFKNWLVEFKKVNGSQELLKKNGRGKPKVSYLIAKNIQIEVFNF